MNKTYNDASDSVVVEELYAKRDKIQPREVHGLFAWLRNSALVLLLGFYYIIPWVQYSDRQAILFDLPARKFYIFELIIWPQDFIFLAALLMIAAFTLFFVTALAGRVWCGYTCPQTVWTGAFVWIESKIEGGRSRRLKLDRAPWSTHKVIRRGGKHLAWVLFALWTGFTFVGYFSPIVELGQRSLQFALGPWESFWIFFYGLATYGNAGWLREQVCIYMCPYARFQSVMFDPNTLIISYDKARGEARGPRKRSADPAEKGLGDCIDCTICVQACPTGIDIRDGLQYQCIGCAACIDACDDVMDKMGYDKGLVRYTTENELMGKASKIFRPRIIIYAVILSVLFGSVIWGLVHREIVSLDVIRDRNALYRENNEGLIENIYTLKIINKHEQAHQFSLSAAGLPGLILLTDQQTVSVGSGEVRNVIVRLQVDPVDLAGKRAHEVTFTVKADDDSGFTTVEEARFLGPTRL